MNTLMSDMKSAAPSSELRPKHHLTVRVSNIVAKSVALLDQGRINEGLQIYLGVQIATGTTLGGGGVTRGAVTGGGLTSVQKTVKKGSMWKPSMIDGHRDFEVSGSSYSDSDLLIVQINLFEQDNAKLYSEMTQQSQFNGLLKPQAFDWKEVGSAVAGAITDKNIVKALSRISKAGFTSLAQDDLIGEATIHIPSDSQDGLGAHSLSYERGGQGSFQVTVEIQRHKA
jgi:hypothetical protein